MKYLSLLFALLISIFVTSCSQETTGYLVERVEDGDTIVINIDGQAKRIQLVGIDAPENTENAKLKVDIEKKGLPKADLLNIGNEASKYLEALVYLSKNKVTLWADLEKKDQYGRIPAEVFDKDGMSLNEKMVAEGFAVVLTRFPLEESFKAKLESAQKRAIENRTGLWRSHRDITIKWSGREDVK